MIDKKIKELKYKFIYFIFYFGTSLENNYFK